MPNKKNQIEVKRGSAEPVPMSGRAHPFATLRQEIDRLFEDFAWPGFRLPVLQRPAAIEPVWNLGDVWSLSPSVDLVEKKDGFCVTAELPGLEQKDIEVRLSDGMLTIQGEKSEEKTEDKQDYHLRERSYGSFQRSFRLPNGIDADKVDAKFENGVLVVNLPKTAESRAKERKIEVKAA